MGALGAEVISILTTKGTSIITGDCRLYGAAYDELIRTVRLDGAAKYEAGQFIFGKWLNDDKLAIFLLTNISEEKLKQEGQFLRLSAPPTRG
jgi:hypothetical protein